jgi:hypothetical protein
MEYALWSLATQRETRAFEKGRMAWRRRRLGDRDAGGRLSVTLDIRVPRCMRHKTC